MKTQNQVRITNENAMITESNVQHIGECIALSAIKKMMHFADHPKSLDKLYAGWVEDIYHSKGYNTTFSDGYDLASEVICFLLQMIYTCAIKEVQTKLDILSTEFNLKHKRNPISSIHTQLKRTESIMKS